VLVGLLVLITASIWAGCSSTGDQPKAEGAAVKAAEPTPPTPTKEEATKSEPAVADTAGSSAASPKPSAPIQEAPLPIGSPEYWAEQIRQLEKNLKPIRSIAVPARPAKSRSDLVSASLSRE